MQRSSNKIGTLATALAKAQSELANPEKSLVATLPTTAPGGQERSYRYASLASGLELVRKCLGQHEIATVQATSIDRDMGLIRLTTTLVHASGEWMSSEWPVCPASETASPHRMGAALTYARRYALFTLVGIAGEDDLDAPDLLHKVIPEAGSSRRQEFAEGPGERHPSAPPEASGSLPRPSEGRVAATRPKVQVLSADASANLREQLLTELAKLDEVSALTAWTQKTLPRKNQLSNTDAIAVEAAFENALTRVGNLAPENQTADRNGRELAPPGRAGHEVIVLSKPSRERDRLHRRHVARQPCLVCGRTPSDAHHIKFAESWTAGRKVSDRFTVPLCRMHHHELHRRGNERAWWQQKTIDPMEIAKALWDKTHASADDAFASEHAINGSRDLGNVPFGPDIP